MKQITDNSVMVVDRPTAHWVNTLSIQQKSDKRRKTSAKERKFSCPLVVTLPSQSVPFWAFLTSYESSSLALLRVIAAPCGRWRKQFMYVQITILSAGASLEDILENAFSQKKEIVSRTSPENWECRQNYRKIMGAEAIQA